MPFYYAYNSGGELVRFGYHACSIDAARNAFRYGDNPGDVVTIYGYSSAPSVCQPAAESYPPSTFERADFMNGGRYDLDNPPQKVIEASRRAAQSFAYSGHKPA